MWTINRFNNLLNLTLIYFLEDLLAYAYNVPEAMKLLYVCFNLLYFRGKLK
jgi:hypothetical protein